MPPVSIITPGRPDRSTPARSSTGSSRHRAARIGTGARGAAGACASASRSDAGVAPSSECGVADALERAHERRIDEPVAALGRPQAGADGRPQQRGCRHDTSRGPGSGPTARCPARKRDSRSLNRQHERALAVGRLERRGRARQQPVADQQTARRCPSRGTCNRVSVAIGCSLGGPRGRRRDRNGAAPSSTPTATTEVPLRARCHRRSSRRPSSGRSSAGPRPAAAGSWWRAGSWLASSASTARKPRRGTATTVSRSGPGDRRRRSARAAARWSRCAPQLPSSRPSPPRRRGPAAAGACRDRLAGRSGGAASRSPWVLVRVVTGVPADARAADERARAAVRARAGRDRALPVTAGAPVLAGEPLGAARARRHRRRSSRCRTLPRDGGSRRCSTGRRRPCGARAPERAERRAVAAVRWPLRS